MYLYVSNEHVVMYVPSTQQHTHMLLQIDFFKIDNNVVVMLWCLMPIYYYLPQATVARTLLLYWPQQCPSYLHYYSKYV